MLLLAGLWAAILDDFKKSWKRASRWLSDKNLPASAGDTGSDPGAGRSHVPWSNRARKPQLPSLCSGAQEPQLRSPCTATADVLLCALEPAFPDQRSHRDEGPRTSLVVSWLRIRLPMRGTWAQSLAWEDAKSNEASVPTTAEAREGLCSARREGPAGKSCAPQLEKSPHRKDDQHRCECRNK